MLRAEDVKEEFLICGICTREYDEDSHVPRILPCLHSFCQTCLRKIVKINLIECPLCKQEHLVPAEGVNGFAKDTTRRNLIDFINVRRRSSEILCKDCPEDQTAKDFCKECYIFMCSDCTRAHKRSLASRKHSVLTIKELQNSGIDVFRRKLVCSKPGHEGQQLAFYCTKKGCETSICTACTVCDHERSKGHEIINVQDIYNLKKAEMDKLFKSLEGDISAARLILQQTEQELLNMDIKELEVEKDIDDSFDKCKKLLTKRQKKLKDQLSVLCDHKKSDIQKHVEALENYLDSAAGAKDFSQHVLSHTDPTEFVPLHATLLQRLQTMSNLKLSVLCDHKKSDIQKHVEALENYLDSAAGVKDFSQHVLSHTDPTEFVPLHATLLQRLQTMSNLKVDRQVFNIESPVFESKPMEAQFLSLTKALGEIGTIVQQKRLSISRGHTHIGMASASSGRRGDDDKRFGDILCPGFCFDSETVHQYREISDNRRVLRNYATVQRHSTIPGGRRLKKYRGVVSTRAFHPPGRFYFEVFVAYNITRPLDNINFVFEIGVSRRSDIDNGYYVYDQLHAWSFCAQHCEDHTKVCLWCRHHGRNLAHFPLTSNLMGTTFERTFGFLLDTDRCQFSVVDASTHRVIYTFQSVDSGAGLWPVFGCHWPSKVKLEMRLRSGRDIDVIPEVLQQS